MDERAVVALVVVLDRDLPVGRQLVLVGDGGPQALALPRGRQCAEPAQVILEGPRRAVHVDEHPATPLGVAHREKPHRSRVEVRHVPEVGRQPERPVELVAPGVVRALDDSPDRPRATGQQFVSAVATDVGEGVQLAGPVPRQQHPGGADADRLLRRRLAQLIDTARAHPTAVEEMGSLPLEHARVDIGRARQHLGLAEGPEAGRKILGGQRCRVPVHRQRLLEGRSGRRPAGESTTPRTARPPFVGQDGLRRLPTRDAAHAAAAVRRRVRLVQAVDR